MKGSCVLYMILKREIEYVSYKADLRYFTAIRVFYLQAYVIFDINVIGFVVRGVSTTYIKTVGYEAAMVSVIICPDADHVNTCGFSKLANFYIAF